MSALSNSDDASTITSPVERSVATELEPKAKIESRSGSTGINNPTKISFAISKPPEHVKLGNEDADSPQDTATQKSNSTEQNVTLKNEPTESNSSETFNNNNVGGTGENKKKRKRSRWDQAGSTIVKEAPTPSIDLNSIQGVSVGVSGYEISGYSSSSSSSSHTLARSSTTTAATSANSDRSVPPQQNYTFSDKRKFVKYSDTYKSGMVRIGSKWVYPEDEITDGGTWEHKKRAEEMKKTAEQAALLTSHAEAKRAHHIADFLPKEELERFEQKVKAVKTGGTTPTYEDYASNKLDQSNIGFKMLMKQGWQAGSGLGKSGEGIAAPINKADTRPANAGLGQTKPEGVEEEDDEFEIYRKRMMLAYRFRPNPLNNPRRPYY